MLVELLAKLLAADSVMQVRERGRPDAALSLDDKRKDVGSRELNATSLRPLQCYPDDGNPSGCLREWP